MLDFHVTHGLRILGPVGMLSLAFATSTPLYADTADIAEAADTANMTEQARHPDNFTGNAYITDIGTLLYHDRDNDSYFAGLSLTIDADTPYHDDRVYASIDLIGPDQIIERLHTTADFTIYRSSVTDEYRIDIDLVRNYRSAVYDLQIGLHDARNDRLLDRVGSSHFSNLRQLPLESEDFDLEPITPPNDVSTTPVNSVNNNIRVDEYGGGTGIALLAILALGIAGRQTTKGKQG